MVKLDSMGSAQNRSLWRNRRVQRSGAFAFIMLNLVVLALYRRHGWPSVTDIHLNTIIDLQTNALYTATQNPKIPSQTVVKPETSEDPLHSVLEFDPQHMPKVQTASQASGNPNYTASSNPPETPNKSDSYHVTLDPTSVAMIIETRRVPHLPALLTHFISTLPLAWSVQLVGLEEAFSIVRESSALRSSIKSGRLVLRDLPDYYPVTSQESISITLTNLTFYEEFVRPAEWLLMFQTDSIICAASNQSIDDWVEKGYDWVGAPWNNESKGGNGGLSLRHVPAIVKLLQDPANTRPPNNDEQYEDFWLSTRLPNVPAGREMVTFSVESVYNERPLGYHLRGSGALIDAKVWGNETQKRQIFDYCPEVKIIMPGLG